MVCSSQHVEQAKRLTFESIAGDKILAVKRLFRPGRRPRGPLFEVGLDGQDHETPAQFPSITIGLLTHADRIDKRRSAELGLPQALQGTRREDVSPLTTPEFLTDTPFVGWRQSQALLPDSLMHQAAHI